MIFKRVELAEAGRRRYLGADRFLTFPVLYFAITYQMSQGRYLSIICKSENTARVARYQVHTYKRHNVIEDKTQREIHML